MEKDEKLILVVLPLTLPGCGKSSLISLASSKLTSDSCECISISSETIRLKVLKKFSTMPTEFAQKKSLPNYNKIFVEELRILCINRLDSLLKCAIKSYKRTHIIFIDKNHPPDAIRKSTKYLLKAIHVEYAKK